MKSCPASKQLDGRIKKRLPLEFLRVIIKGLERQTDGRMDEWTDGQQSDPIRDLFFLLSRFLRNHIQKSVVNADKCGDTDSPTSDAPRWTGEGLREHMPV
ncbi:hypothetical protein EVAR_31277_1 [Eumeta japonica]|uniref:Uncharacterized protein n=1 Tax=Eumeta variegata TaxID=151549 RepID=A0A4C1VRY3_EUMVA|nr:hypothetical protein EVAR_31277_1 [Eumeta japonica]